MILGQSLVLNPPYPPLQRGKAQCDVGAKPSVKSPLTPFAKGEGAKRESDMQHSIGKHMADMCPIDMRPAGMRLVGRPRQAPPL